MRTPEAPNDVESIMVCRIPRQGSVTGEITSDLRLGMPRPHIGANRKSRECPGVGCSSRYGWDVECQVTIGTYRLRSRKMPVSEFATVGQE